MADAGAQPPRHVIAVHAGHADVEQREGRILRQGNLNPEVQIYRYVTERSFEAYMWQTLETKAKFIGQVVTVVDPIRQERERKTDQRGHSGSEHGEPLAHPTTLGIFLSVD